MVRHKNDYGYWEEVDRLPIPGCSCNKCTRAADRDAERQSRRSQRRREFPPDNATVSGQSGYAKQRDDRIQAWWGEQKESEIATNDGVNAAYLREDGTDIVDEAQDDPYKKRSHRRRR